MSEEAKALAATLRAIAPDEKTSEAAARAVALAAQLSALRAGADTEDLRAGAENWRKRAEEAEATLDARSVGYAEAVEAVRSEIRRQALEEAATECDRIAACEDAVVLRLYSGAEKCSAAIRALADKPATGGDHG